MANITMCNNTQCPNAGNCYRVLAKPNPYWQAYSTFEYALSPSGVACKYYTPINHQVKIDVTA